MNMSDKCKALVLILLLFVFLVQCHPHEDIIVGTTRGQAAFSLTKIALCQREKLDNKMMYCCTLQRPIVCYGTFKLCKTNCYSHNRK
ncbi:hypothetical protein BDA96_04G211000 [Sorghum bicolor]|uniref:Uncharacterized protein n=2 Tax=Sorghum bicolor TaxID=4558 RepID=A0A921UJD0_SORBI|nr:hypothetical protein BDA96_04G211000 [Sorghum bicolor]OQU85232.1 hypothetical protein SORBI_3004G198550 [Sorghum bicolor]